jgi:RNA polymerase sigma factor (sigma-70 family)
MSPPGHPSMAEDPSESTVELLDRFKAGDSKALETLLQRHLPRLRRWASGRLPRNAREGGDTEDLVQETIVRTLKTLGKFEYRREGALQAYLRQAVANGIRDRLRHAGRRPIRAPLEYEARSTDQSPLDEAIGQEAAERYDQALAGLDPDDREAIVGRLELGYDYVELALALGKPSADAARMAVRRAVLKLATRMTAAERRG